MTHAILRDLVSGSVAGTTTILVMTPLDTARTRLQVAAAGVYTNGFQVIASSIRHEGVRSLYQGMLSPLLAQGVYKMVMFSAFGVSSRFMESRNWSLSNPPVAFACGAFAGFLNSFVVCPVVLVRNRLAVQRASADSQYKGPVSVIHQTLQSRGFRGMFQGLGATILRDGPGVGAYFTTFHLVKNNVDISDSARIPFAGACAGVAFWTVALPADALKTRVQVTQGKANIMSVARELDFFHVYRSGLGIAILRGIPGASITFTVQTSVSNWIDRKFGT